MKTQVPMRHRL